MCSKGLKDSLGELLWSGEDTDSATSRAKKIRLVQAA